MKPAPFEYVRAGSVEEAVARLRASDGDARLLAGGQSLVPLLNMRLARPACVVDVNSIDGLDRILEEDGVVRIGALVRHAALEWSPVVAARAPLLACAVRYVGDRQVRMRGSLGGSLAHADPTGELPLAAVALEATIRVQGPDGTRELPAAELFEGPYATTLAGDEMITEVAFPAAAGALCAFAEVARRHGDFAVLAVAAIGEPGGDGSWRSVRIALGGVAGRPFVAGEASELAAGAQLEPDVVAAIGEACAGAAEPYSDIRASAEYRRHLIPIYVARALGELEQRRHEARA
jgi:carbon-monoxide dehydrogenase medium subunit